MTHRVRGLLTVLRSVAKWLRQEVVELPWAKYGICAVELFCCCTFVQTLDLPTWVVFLAFAWFTECAIFSSAAPPLGYQQARSCLVEFGAG